MMSAFQREDLHDVIGVHCFRVESHGFTPRMTLAVGTVLDSSPLQFHALVFMDLFH
jgi:hypothetical protein